jgi:hypothetical protein
MILARFLSKNLRQWPVPRDPVRFAVELVRAPIRTRVTRARFLSENRN